MTLLTFNKTPVCPECGCMIVVAESIEVERAFDTTKFPPKIRYHVNGQRWETRTFLCGYSCEFVPNFGRCEPKRKCTQTEQYKSRRADRSRLEAEIQNLRTQLDALE